MALSFHSAEPRSDAASASLLGTASFEPERRHRMEILVTGGTGRLGRVVVERLRADGHTVRVLSRSSKPGVITGDLRRDVGLGPAVAGADVIVHCAIGRDHVRATRNLVR